MNLSSIFAWIVARIGAVALTWRRLQARHLRLPGAVRRWFQWQNHKARSRR